MSKIINFTNQDLPESSNGLEDYIGYLRTTADILEGCNIYAQDMGTSTLAVIGLDFSEFSFVSEKSTTSPEGLISLTYMYQSQNAVYTAVFDFDLAEDSISFDIIKQKNETTYFYNFKDHTWEEEKGLDIPKELEDILDEDTLEADFVQEYIGDDQEEITVKGYKEFRNTYSALYALYDKTHMYMDPSCFFPLYENKPCLYLRPKDLFRHGFVVGCEGNTYILYQEAGIYEHWNEPYIHEVGRTDDILQMKQCLNKLANRYTDDDIFTLPLSLDAYTESKDPKNLGNDFVMGDRTQLTKQEIKNFYSGKKAMKKLEQYI